MKDAVLIVDDTETNLKLLELYIQKYRPEYKVFSSTDGVDALNMFVKAIGDGYTFKSIIMDLNMPGMNGIETLKSLEEYYKHHFGVTMEEAGIKYDIFTANDLFGCGDSEYCGDEKECDMVCNIGYKPLTKDKLNQML